MKSKFEVFKSSKISLVLYYSSALSEPRVIVLDERGLFEEFG